MFIKLPNYVSRATTRNQDTVTDLNMLRSSLYYDKLSVIVSSSPLTLALVTYAMGLLPDT